MILVALFYGQGCVYADCNGMWTYDASEWNTDEIALMHSAAARINTWMGSENVFIHKALPHEVDNTRCMIRKVHYTELGGEEKDGKIMHADRHIEIAVGRMTERYDDEKVMTRIEVVMAHEFLHGLGFEHVPGTYNVMADTGGKSSFSAISESGFGKADTAQCIELGYCD